MKQSYFPEINFNLASRGHRMTKYYCGMVPFVYFVTSADYCDIYLTHDAPRVRRDHNSGWKHAIQVRAHYMAVNQDRMARTVSEIVKDYEERHGKQNT